MKGLKEFKRMERCRHLQSERSDWTDRVTKPSRVPYAVYGTKKLKDN